MALGLEPSGVIFFIKKQNLNQENKVIKFLLRTAGPVKPGATVLLGASTLVCLAGKQLNYSHKQEAAGPP